MEQEMTPEQQEELRKKLENMSPEELKEFQKKQCIFCHIVSGKVQAKKVFEDDKVVGVLDINPANPGHILLMPKEHHMIMPQLPEDELIHIFIAAKHLSNAVLRALDVRGTNIIVANGPAAGQKAQHFMLHIIPRKEGDGVEFTLPSKKHSEEELEQIAIKVRTKINEMLGKAPIKASEPKVVEAEFKDKEEEKPSQDIEDKKEDDSDEKEETNTEDEDDKEGEGSEETDGSSEEDDDPEDDSDNADDDSDEGDDGVDLDSIARVLNG